MRRIRLVTGAFLAVTLTAAVAAVLPSATGVAPDHAGPALDRPAAGFADSPTSRRRTRALRVASGEYHGMAWTDPAEAVADSRDLRSVDLYTTPQTGMVTFVAKFQAAPTSQNTSVAVYWGELSGSTCVARQIVVGDANGGGGGWITLTSGGAADGQGSGVRATRVGTRVVVEVRNAALAARPRACAFATSSSDNGSTTYDETGWVRLGTVAQKLEQYFGHTIGSAKNTPRHTGRVVGRKGKVRIGIRSSVQGLDTSDVRDVNVTLRGGSALRVGPGLARLGTIELVDDKTAVFDVTLRKRTTVRARWIAAGDYGVTDGVVTVHPLGKPLAMGRSLAGKRFWAKTDLDWVRQGVWFVNRSFAYLGFPNGGRPTCRKASKRCVRYTWRPSAKRLVIGGKAARVTKGGFVWKGRTFRQAAVPSAGARWDTAVRHTNATTSGTLEYLDLSFDGKGRFSSSRRTYARPVTGASARPAEARTPQKAGALPQGRGTYRVLKNGHLRLTYASGVRRNLSVGVLTDSQRRPNPWDVGLMVGPLDYTFRG